MGVKYTELDGAWASLVIPNVFRVNMINANKLIKNLGSIKQVWHLVVSNFVSPILDAPPVN